MSENCESCQVSARVDRLEKEFDSYRENSSETHKEMFKRLGDLEQATAVQDNKLDTIGDKLDDIQANNKSILQKVETLEAKPGKRWETLVACIISALGTAFVMWLFMGMPGDS